MTFFPFLQQQLDTLRRLVGEAPVLGSIPERLHRLSDEDLHKVLDIATSIERQAERLRLVSASVLTQRAPIAEQPPPRRPARPLSSARSQVSQQAQHANPQLANMRIHADA